MTHMQSTNAENTEPIKQHGNGWRWVIPAHSASYSQKYENNIMPMWLKYKWAVIKLLESIKRTDLFTEDRAPWGPFHEPFFLIVIQVRWKIAFSLNPL